MRSYRLISLRLLLFLSILGPGLITANVDNDANGVATYSVAGAHYGYSLLWVLIVISLFQAVIQEMTSRMGIITGKGLSDLIRENFGLRITFWLMVILFIGNMANTIGDFAGLAAAMELFGVSRNVSVPIGALAMWLLVVKGSYGKVERLFLFACLIYFCYIFSGILARPDWNQVGNALIHPKLPLTTDCLNLTLAIVGTTIAPWMQFFQQSLTRDKGTPKKHMAVARIDTFLGTAMMTSVAAFIIIACAATLHAKGIAIQGAEDAARALEPLAGQYCKLLFAVGLVNAALFSFSIIPLSTSYAICEAFGWESGLSTGIAESPAFYGIYTGMLILGGGIILLPGIPLFSIMILSQTLNGILLPVILVFILLIINNRKIMGKWVNSRIYNLIAALAVTATIAGTVLLMLSLFVKLGA